MKWPLRACIHQCLTTGLALQRLQGALDVGTLPSTQFFPRPVQIPFFSAEDPVVALSAGYVFWLALTASGKVYACGTGFDGYAGLLPNTIAHGGWATVNQVWHCSHWTVDRHPADCLQGIRQLKACSCQKRLSGISNCDQGPLRTAVTVRFWHVSMKWFTVPSRPLEFDSQTRCCAVCLQGLYLGRSGVRDRPSSLRPWLIEGATDVVSIAAGRTTAAVVTRSGELLTWGMPPLGRAGMGDAVAPAAGMDSHRAVQVCMGEYHGAVLTSNGTLLGWGSTGDGQVQAVNGVPLTYTVAALLGRPYGVRASGLACGFQHTLVVGSNCTGGSAANSVQDVHSIGASATAQSSPEPSGLFSIWPAAHSFLGLSSNGQASKQPAFDEVPPSTMWPALALVKPAEQQADADSVSAPRPAMAPTGLPEPRSAPSDAAFQSLRIAEEVGTSVPSSGSEEQDRAPTQDSIQASGPSESRQVQTTGAQQTGSQATTSPGVGVLGTSIKPVWSVEECPNGPRPPWVANCEAVPQTASRLDKAWLGRFAASSWDKVPAFEWPAKCSADCLHLSLAPGTSDALHHPSLQVGQESNYCAVDS